MSDQPSVGELFRETRERLGLTQAELGELIGRSPSFVSKAERGVKAFENVRPAAELLARGDVLAGVRASAGTRRRAAAGGTARVRGGTPKRGAVAAGDATVVTDRQLAALARAGVTIVRADVVVQWGTGEVITSKAPQGIHASSDQPLTTTLPDIELPLTDDGDIDYDALALIAEGSEVDEVGNGYGASGLGAPVSVSVTIR